MHFHSAKISIFADRHTRIGCWTLRHHQRTLAQNVRRPKLTAHSCADPSPGRPRAAVSRACGWQGAAQGRSEYVAQQRGFSIDAIGAFDHVPRQAMFAGLKHRTMLAAGCRLTCANSMLPTAQFSARRWVPTYTSTGSTGSLPRSGQSTNASSPVSPRSQTCKRRVYFCTTVPTTSCGTSRPHSQPSSLRIATPLLRPAWAPSCTAAISSQQLQYGPRNLPLGLADSGCNRQTPIAMPRTGPLCSTHCQQTGQGSFEASAAAPQRRHAPRYNTSVLPTKRAGPQMLPQCCLTQGMHESRQPPGQAMPQEPGYHRRNRATHGEQQKPHLALAAAEHPKSQRGPGARSCDYGRCQHSECDARV